MTSNKKYLVFKTGSEIGDYLLKLSNQFDGKVTKLIHKLNTQYGISIGYRTSTVYENGIGILSEEKARTIIKTENFKRIKIYPSNRLDIGIINPSSLEKILKKKK